MRPLKITAEMLTGEIITSDRYLPLDSVIAAIWMAQNCPEVVQTSQSAVSLGDIIAARLPLARKGRGATWYWACSFACGEAQRETIVYWHKRFDTNEAEQFVDFGKRRGSVDAKSGHYKNYRMPMVKILVPKLTWYAVGNREKMYSLVMQVTGIGKKRSQGFGRIASWSVEECDEDLSHLRAIPDPDGDLLMGIRPPYWLSSQHTKARLPNDERLLCHV